MFQRLEEYFRRNRVSLAIVLVVGVGFFERMLYGTAQRAVGYREQYTIKAPVMAYDNFIQSADANAFKGATMYVRADGSALLVKADGSNAEIPNFALNTSVLSLRSIRQHGVTVEGGVNISTVPALPSAAQATVAAFSETLGRLGGSLLSIGFVIFMVLYAKSNLGAAGGLFKKKYHTYDAKAGDKLPVRLADVAGMEGPKVELAEVVDYLKDPGKFRALGARPPKGVLLYGPPGNGKTLLAKAIAGEAGVPFIEQNASSFVNMVMGAGAAGARELFTEARRLSKERGGCVVFIDEIDAVGTRRDLGGHDERLQTLNGLLAEMDGFGDNTGIVVIAATNRLEMLDTALTRPGRFDRKVQIPLPGLKAIPDILRVHLTQLKRRDANLDLDKLARMGRGMSGADLANWVNEAAIEAARRGDPQVTMEHFVLARDRVLIGPRNFGIELLPEEELAVAYHESGHAVVRKELGGHVDRVTILPHGGSLGVTFSTPDERIRFTRETLNTELAVLMGGRAAEEVFTGTVSSGAASDLERASRMAFEGVTMLGLGNTSGFVPQTEAGRGKAEERAAELVEEAYKKALSILSEEKAKVEALTQRLMDEKTVAMPFGAV